MGAVKLAGQTFPYRNCSGCMIIFKQNYHTTSCRVTFSHFRLTGACTPFTATAQGLKSEFLF